MVEIKCGENEPLMMQVDPLAPLALTCHIPFKSKEQKVLLPKINFGNSQNKIASKEKTRKGIVSLMKW